MRSSLLSGVITSFNSSSISAAPSILSPVVRNQTYLSVQLPSSTRYASSIAMSFNQNTGSNRGVNGRGRKRSGRGRGRGGGGGRVGRGGSSANGIHSSSSNHTSNIRSNSTLSTSNHPNGNQGEQDSEMETAEPSISVPSSSSSSHLSTTTFSSLSSNIDPRILSSIPFDLMTEVQSKTLHPALSGVDLLAQAKTGTGKTLAFLIPSIETICRMKTKPEKGQISVLVLSPTRELALQIKTEAQMLLKGMKEEYEVQHCVGGTNISTETRNLSSRRVDLLIATPGRLLDHLQKGLASQLQNLKVLILDEADRMLDMGFKQELEKIMSYLPDRNQVKRQHLLFSATIPDSIHKVSNLDKNHLFINTLGEDETNTHQHVAQEFIIADFIDFLPLSLELIRKEQSDNAGKGKIIFFFPTARWTGLAAEVFRNLNGKDVPRIFEIHSRKSQPQRAKASEEFKKVESGIMFSSDVAARGVDWPGVTAVVQVGLPSSGEQYIHRLGRTARAGGKGHGVLILTPSEKFFLNKGEMRGLPLQEVSKESFSTLESSKELVNEALAKVSDDIKSQCYAASLGYYKGSLKDLKWKPDTLVSEMNMFAIQALLYNGGDGSIPPMMAKTVGKMGMKGVPGLNIVRELPPREGFLNGDGGRGGRGAGSQRGSGGGGAGAGGGRGGNQNGRGRGAPY